MEGRGGPDSRGVRVFFLLVFLLAGISRALKVQHTHTMAEFFLESFPSGEKVGEVVFAFDDEEILHVDRDQERTVWRLPDFKQVAIFEARGALSNLAVLERNLEITMNLTNRTQAQNVPPSAIVYPEDPIELGDPNVLICFVDKFFPPVLNITWLKNGQVVPRGVAETTFYPNVDNTFRKFSYLSFIPQEGDVYACQVDHWALQGSLTRLWYPKVPPPASEMPENLLCGLGLTLGILGVIVGPVLFFKARKMNQDQGGM
nr:RLA class II histocompatibility antigen, DP alpha-1 chain-like [Pogona vitticeps]